LTPYAVWQKRTSITSIVIWQHGRRQVVKR